MKYNCWLMVGAMLSTSLLAQQATNPTPSAPIEMPAAAPAATLTPSAATTNAPAAKAVKKRSAKKKGQKAPPKKAVEKKKAAMPELRTVPLVPGPAVVDANNVNVRGQPKIKSEVLARLTRGQTVTVIEEIVRNNSGPEEPSAWAKIVLPTNAHVWASSTYIDASNQTVKAKKLNLRSGPGENYSVIGRLQGGDAVKPITTKGDWTEIEAPTNAYAFMAAQYSEAGEAGSTGRAGPDAHAGGADADADDRGGRPAGGARPDGSAGRAPVAGDPRDDEPDSGSSGCAVAGGTAAAADRAARGHCAWRDQHPGAVEVRAHQPGERQPDRLSFHDVNQSGSAALQGLADHRDG